MSSLYDLPVPVPAPALAPEFAPGPAPVRATRPRLRAVPDVRLDFEVAVRNLRPRLVRYAARRIGDVHEAEELVQEALLRAYDHRDELLTEDELAAWSTVVTGRLVIDRLRIRARTTTVAEVPEGSRVGRDTAEVVVARDEARTALDALEALPSRQAAVLWAREVEGLAYDEIGVRYGMTEATVRSLLTRARKALRKEYASRGGTLPLAGISLLAPWAQGLHWAARLRHTLGRAGVPAALGVLGISLVGGALLSPGSAGSVPGGAALGSTVHSASVALRPLETTPASRAGSVVRSETPPSTRAVVLSGTGPVSILPTSCALDHRFCGHHNPSSTAWLGLVLPSTVGPAPREVGVDQNFVDCRRLPETSVLHCGDRPHTSPASPTQPGGLR